MASILNPATRTVGVGTQTITPLAGTPPNLTGSTSTSVNFTLTDPVTNSSSGVSTSYPWQVVARPATGPPAVPGTQDQRNMYANRVVRKLFAGVDATAGQTLTYATFPDVLCCVILLRSPTSPAFWFRIWVQRRRHSIAPTLLLAISRSLHTACL